MPEGLEAEIWRAACEPLVGRTVVDASVDERIVPDGFTHVIVGATITGVRRVGKIVVLDTRRVGEQASLPIGLHFGMTGRLIVDGVAAIERLSYASGRDAAEWDRCVLFTDPSPTVGVPALRFNDPRRLGRVTIDPDLDRLGIDFFAVTATTLGAALGRRGSALKTVLLDQHVIAGLGNLLADEMLWWSDLSPHRSANALDARDVARLAARMRRRLPIMLRRGGSTMGTLSPDVRAAAGVCERDGHALRRDTIGGRTTIWCPLHQH